MPYERKQASERWGRRTNVPGARSTRDLLPNPRGRDEHGLEKHGLDERRLGKRALEECTDDTRLRPECPMCGDPVAFVTATGPHTGSVGPCCCSVPPTVIERHRDG